MNKLNESKEKNILENTNSLELAKLYLARTSEELTPIQYLSKLIDLQGEFAALLRESDDFSVLDDQDFAQLHNSRFGHLSLNDL